MLPRKGLVGVSEDQVAVVRVAVLEDDMKRGSSDSPREHFGQLINFSQRAEGWTEPYEVLLHLAEGPLWQSQKCEGGGGI